MGLICFFSLHAHLETDISKYRNPLKLDLAEKKKSKILLSEGRNRSEISADTICFAPFVPDMAAINDSAHSSPEEYDDDTSTVHDGQWQSQLGADRTSPLTGDKISLSSQASKFPPPMQKRRRVTRACDECRRKKIKCDGKQPCTHCTVYSYG